MDTRRHLRLRRLGQKPALDDLASLQLRERLGQQRAPAGSLAQGWVC